jgi:hypothetical protein
VRLEQQSEDVEQPRFYRANARSSQPNRDVVRPLVVRRALRLVGSGRKPDHALVTRIHGAGGSAHLRVLGNRA